MTVAIAPGAVVRVMAVPAVVARVADIRVADGQVADGQVAVGRVADDLGEVAAAAVRRRAVKHVERHRHVSVTATNHSAPSIIQRLSLAILRYLLPEAICAS